MKSKYRNIFLAFGIVVVIIMLLTMNMSYEELWQNLLRAGYYLPLIILLWLVVYVINTCSWYVILHSSGPVNIPFWRLYKYSVSGFALNYVTPVGLMGGEPYRIMELTPYVGVERATSSVILFVMMHIFSHFCFWMSSVLIYVFFYPVNWSMGVLMGFITLFCLSLGLLFIKGYRHGMAVACMNLASRIPFIKKYALAFAEKNKAKLENIDKQIALVHKQDKRSFYGSLFLEYLARIVSCGEVWLILNVLTTNVSFVDCILILAFSSLMANLLFFMPMQLGGREGGFALAVNGIAVPGAYGVYAALITRIRELVWIVIGLALMKIGNKNMKDMVSDSKVKALAFDFGGTLDSPFLHWAQVYIKVYNEQLGLSLTRESFWDSYVFAEREMERLNPVKTTDTLLDVQTYKTRFQFDDLIRRGLVEDTEYNRNTLPAEAARLVTEFSTDYVKQAKPVLEKLKEKYILFVVSNYYGNLKAVLQSMGVADLFHSITDSTIAGIRKPDPALWKLAIDQEGFLPEEVIVVGDSQKNDVNPALSLGCHVVKCCPDEAAVVPGLTCIRSLTELEGLLL